MTNTFNIAGTDGNVMVPVLNETGSLMAYLLYPDPTGTLQELSSWMTIPSAFPHKYVTTHRHSNIHSSNNWGGAVYDSPFIHKNAFGCTGQPIIHTLKSNNMAKSTTTGGITADRIKNDAAFERTRENMAEFSRAGKAAKILRAIFRDVTINAKDRNTQARMVKVMSRIITTDQANERGARTVNNGDLLQLLGFNFNVKAGIADSLYVRCPVNFNRALGEVTVNIPAFVPRNMVQQSRGMTHFRIIAAATAVNLETGQYDYAMQATPELPYNSDVTQAAILTMVLPANSPNSVVAVLGIEYYQKVNTRSYALKSGDHNATSIILVDKV